MARLQPAPATLFRLRVYDETAFDLVQQAKQKFAPILKLRDGGKLKKIEAAQTPDELIDLAPQMTGRAGDAWQMRLRSFGPAAVAAICAVLPEVRRLEDETLRRRVYSLLIAALRWQGDAGDPALLESWGGLDEIGRGFASVALGLLGCKEAAKPVWDFYRQARTRDSLEFVGALWALLDLDDPRLPGELYHLLDQRRFFYELFGFLARRGDARSLGHLAALMVERGRVGGFEPMMAAAGIARRTGRAAAIAALRRYAHGQQDFSDPSEVADLLLENPPDLVEKVFAIYYRGFQPDDIGGIMHQLDAE